MRSRMLAAVVIVCGALAFTSCAAEPSPGGSSEALEVVHGIPEDWNGPQPDPATGEPVAGRVGSDAFGVVTFGSSSCPPIARSLDRVGAAEFEIAFGMPEQEVCTADMAATTHVFALPTGADSPLTIQLSFEGYDEIVTLSLP